MRETKCDWCLKTVPITIIIQLTSLQNVVVWLTFCGETCSKAWARAHESP